MAWIESHQSLARHPKTLRLAAALRCGVPAAIGYVHLLWYWALDYAVDGQIANDMRDQVAKTCEWRGKAETFWMAMLQAGFVEATETGVGIHDWMDYAGRLVDKRAANAQRMRDARATHSARTESARAGATVPDQPDRTVPPNPLSAQTAAHGASDGPDVAPPRADATPHESDEVPPQTLRPGMAQCPLCRLPYSGPYLDHTAERHKVNAQPANLRGGSLPLAPPADVEAQFAAMHERLQNLPADTEARSE